MKKVLISIVVTAVSQIAVSQTLYVPNASTNGIADSPNSFIGIGTSSPLGSLDIRTVNQSGLIATFLSNAGIPSNIGEQKWTLRIGRAYSYPNRTLDFGMVAGGYGGSPDFYIAPSGNEVFRIKNNGNVGIGTETPTEKFHIYGSGLVRSLVESSDNHAYYVVEGAAGMGSFVDYYRKGDGRIWHTGLRNANNNFEFRLNDQSAVLTLKEDKTVGIGTTNTFGYKLAVNGTIGSTEVKVENTSAWPDFVFENDYDLRTLEEVEQHINEKGHLPEIPSEAEVTENGIKLGEMNAKLLQKIEELTLYLIEQNKQNQTQQEQITVQSALIEQLQNEVSALKSE